MFNKNIFFCILFCSFSLLNAQQNTSEIVVGKNIILHSKFLNEDRNISVHLPFGYNQSSSKYPILIVLDGDLNFMHAVGTTTFLSISRLAPQMIVVGIPNTIRNRDFTPTTSKEMNNTGGGLNFIKFMNDELLPYLEENYRTENFRILYGYSLTGMFSIYNFIKNTDMFDAYIASSPYVLYDNNALLSVAKEGIPKELKKNKFLFFTLGDEPEYKEPIKELNNILAASGLKNLKWKYQYFENDDHATLPLKTLNGGLEFIFADYRMNIDNLQNSSLASIKEHYQNLKNIYGFDVKPAEAIINVYGYQFIQMGNLERGLELFKYNIELYPESANVYDSYGEGLERANKLDEAYKNYEKAYEQGLKNKDPNTEIFKQHLENLKEKI